MRVVNASLQTLSAVVHSGWKASRGGAKGRATEPTAKTVDNAVGEAVEALQRLRVLSPDDMDIERAACSLVGKLLALELHEAVAEVLSGVHSRLTSLMKGSSVLPPPLCLLSLPLSSPRDGALTTLAFTALTYALSALSPLLHSTISLQDFVSALQNHPSLLDLAQRTTSECISEKTKDALLTRAYTSLTKACSHLSSNTRTINGSNLRFIFYLRIYALSCLLHTSPDTIKPSTFWDQVQKACMAYARASVDSSLSRDVKTSEAAAASYISQTLHGLAGRVNGLVLRSFLEARAFLGVCEFWMTLAKRTGDMAMLDYISELIARLSFSQGSERSLTVQVGQLKLRSEGSQGGKSPHEGSIVVECAQFCATLVKATASLENNGKSAENMSSTVPDGNADASLGKIERALERLRRAAIRVLDAAEGGRSDTEARCTLLILLEGITSALGADTAEDNLASLLDTQFVVARNRLNSDDVDTYTLALRQLENAVATIDGSLTVIDPLDSANFLRCISGAFHNLGGTLYKADKHGGAIRFLKQGCIVGTRALSLYTSQGKVDTTNGEFDSQEKEGERNKEGWKQLEEQLFRRYELLGVCYLKIGDRKLSIEAFVQSVRMFPYTLFPSIAAPDPFKDDDGLLKQLASVIERLTYIASCELFLPPEQVSLRHVLEDSSTRCLNINIDGDPPFSLDDSLSKGAITGVLLERQLKTLESVVHKDGVRTTMLSILRDLLAVYNAKWAPARRAGALLCGLDVLWRDRRSAAEDNERGSYQLDVEDMGREVLTLVERELHPVDSGFASLMPKYTLSAHLWLALHSYRRLPAGSEMTSAVTTHIERACEVLLSLLNNTEGVLGDGSSNPKRFNGDASTRANRGGSRKKMQAPMTRTRVTKKPALHPVTPKPRKVLDEVSLNSAAVAKAIEKVERSDARFDLGSLVGLLQMNIHLLGLLGLIVLKVKLLEILKRLCEQQTPVPTEAYSVFCVDLAHEYVKLGKPKRAGSIFNRCTTLLKTEDTPVEVRLRYLLGQAEVLALGDNMPASASVYCEAHSLEDVVAAEDKTAPTVQRIRARVERLERAALACRVFSAIQYSKDDMVGALCTMLQSLRLWNRAVDALSRLSPSRSSASKTTQEDNNVFEAPSNGTPVSDQPTASSDSRASIPVDALSWRLLSSLLTTLLSLSQIFFARGSARDALYFSQQALDLAQVTKASIVAARALTLRSEVLLGQGDLIASQQELVKAAQLLEDLPGIDAADVQRLRGDYEALCEAGQEQNSKESYERARKMLDELEGTLAAIDGRSQRKSSIGTLSGAVVVNPGQGMIVPKLLSRILRRHIWLLRNEEDEDELFKQLVEKLMSLPPSAEIKGEEHAVMGMLTMHSVYRSFQADILLNSLTESAIALPMPLSGGKDASSTPATHDILGALGDAEDLFWADLALTSRCGNVPHVREAAVSLGMIQVLQSALGKVVSDGPLLATCLLDTSSAITLHREMLEAIRHKFPDWNGRDDLQWPLPRASDSPLGLLPTASDFKGSPTTRYPIRASSFSSASSGGSESATASDSLLAYWEALQERYTSATVSPSGFAGLSSEISKLPKNWTAIHIILTPDKSTMFLSRVSSASSLIFCLPLHSRSDSDEQHLTLDEALAEFRDIVRLSDEGTRRAVHVRNDDRAHIAAWWAERAALDKRLQELLENIEFCWLGGFKAILGPSANLAPNLLDDLRVRLDKVLSRILSSSNTKKRQPKSTATSAPSSISRLSEPFLNCLASLPSSCKDEELEDLLCFMFDLYHLHGVPVAISEIDMDHAVVDLRTALCEHRAVRKKAEKKGNAVDDDHIFLVLDRRLQGIPWESIPVLRGRSVSRIPSLNFLLDRVQFAALQSPERGSDSQEEPTVDRISIDPRKAYYILNPSGDLKGTEGRFAPWLKQMHSVGWDGITGHAPSEQQFLNALSQKDLVIYFGHGGGEQYVRSHKLRHLPRCAATMLWGCSSGSLKDMGEFDRVGTPYHYMVSGCPTLVANLWDVTDRDIDKFTQGVVDRLGLTPDGVLSHSGADGGKPPGTSVVAAVAQSRQLCKLKYLTGAAPVVYGIPFYL
ncbi:peptidase family C50-domain-containing protein [Pisolithus orientalis]|uniref:peptidase family C50-domain-containing protein n=1 Tax=Pisolithus orientalis TaxID=936130 RepID=UPI00222475B3|nr:peptidase family C50-domain-containing protein [Pisolithus orientalis]KAI6000295.1 peptidase family C50-domain-containing protein [Pisolithus orientalis]